MKNNPNTRNNKGNSKSKPHLFGRIYKPQTIEYLEVSQSSGKAGRQSSGSKSSAAKNSYLRLRAKQNKVKDKGDDYEASLQGKSRNSQDFSDRDSREKPAREIKKLSSFFHKDNEEDIIKSHISLNSRNEEEISFEAEKTGNLDEFDEPISDY